MAKIGIMGGTFNPIHNAHIQIAKAAYEQFNLDEIWFMPNHIPAYKNAKEVISGKIRLRMVQRAIKDFPYFSVSDYEIKRTGKTYTYETLSMLAKDYPEHSFYFIMGADSLFYFEKWKHPEIITKHASVLVAVRDDKGPKEIQDKMDFLNQIYGENTFSPIITPVYTGSSSEIRNAFYQKEYHTMPLDDFLNKYHITKETYQLIIQNNLYTSL